MYKFSVAKHILLTNKVPSFVATICWARFQAFIDQHNAGCSCCVLIHNVFQVLAPKGGLPFPAAFRRKRLSKECRSLEVSTITHCRCYQTCPVNPNKTKHVETSTFDKSGADGSSHTSDYTAGIRAPRCRSSAAMRGATVTVCQCFSLPVPMDTLFSQGWMPWS
jgi:hypothetical protein